MVMEAYDYDMEFLLEEPVGPARRKERKQPVNPPKNVVAEQPVTAGPPQCVFCREPRPALPGKVWCRECQDLRDKREGWPNNYPH